MPLASSTPILVNALNGGYAVGAFNAYNLEMAQAVVQAAEEETAPVILQVSRGTIQHAGLELSAALVKSIAAGARVPVVLHLDHGTDFEINMRCLREGFTSLMYDGSECLLRGSREKGGGGPPREGAAGFDYVVEMVQSMEAFEENVRVTKMVVDAAHACGVPVEAELGRIPRIEEFGTGLPGGTGLRGSTRGEGAERGGELLPLEVRERVARLFASPERAAEFVRLTGCDSLAVACGSVHGMKADVQPLDVRLVAAIASRTGIPLVLHGSSGVIGSRAVAEARGLRLETNEGGVEEAVRSGIAKVNVSTELQAVYLDAVRAHFEREPAVKDVRRVFSYARAALKERVKSYIRLFGSSGKA
jgi:fructose-bisphosphate aldolase class II